MSKTQDILFNFLDSSFEVFDGVPEEISTKSVKVNSSSMVNYCGNQYSVPTEYI